MKTLVKIVLYIIFCTWFIYPPMCSIILIVSWLCIVIADIKIQEDKELYEVTCIFFILSLIASILQIIYYIKTWHDLSFLLK